MSEAGYVPALLGSSDTLVLGEAPGQQEVYFGCPFVGAAGQELYRIFADGGLVPAPPKYLSPLLMQKLWKDSGLNLANVIPIQPPHNQLAAFCTTRAEAIPGLPAMVPGKYLRKEFEPYLDALREITARYRYIIACGNTACWATLAQTKITKLRGRRFDREAHTIFPIFHPAAVLRQWNLRIITVADVENITHRVTSRTPRSALMAPTLEEIAEFINVHLLSATAIAFDIENPRGRISCVGFAASPTLALVIPFEGTSGESYWPSAADEIAAWGYVKQILNLRCPKITQYGLYDIQHLWRRMGITVRNACEDTLFVHHALQPEMQKDLGFLGSLYTDIGEWKSMRKRKDQEK